MRIGPHSLPNQVALAPMAGVTDLPMRAMSVTLGAGYAIGEMVHADPQFNTTRKSRLRRQHDHDAGLRVTQIVGFSPNMLAEAARFNADQGAQVIDINMGCPAKKVCRRAAGSALLADTLLVADILQTVVAAVDVPVTLKIRTGTERDHRNAVEVAQIAADSGIALISVHGRTRADRFRGNAEYETIRKVVQAVDIPVLANGDIDSVNKARQVLDFTGAAGIMIGRAAQGRLWLPGYIAQCLNSEWIAPPSVEQQCDWMTQHLLRLHEFYGADHGVQFARKHVAWFIENLPELTEENDQRAQRQRFNALSSPSAQISLLSAWQEAWRNRQYRPAA